MRHEVAAPPALESWRRVFRRGIAPALDDRELSVLRDALRTDDPRLMQGDTVSPVTRALHFPCRGACALAFVGWQTRNLVTLRDVTDEFNDLLDRIATNLRDDPDCLSWSDFLDWFDHVPRADMLAELHSEVEREITRRADHAHAA